MTALRTYPVEVWPIDLIDPAEDNPRADVGDVTGLADSIRQVGILQPLVATTVEGTDRLLLIAGHRRLAAAKLAGLDQVDVIVEEKATPTDRRRKMLIENLHRADLSPLDKARGFEDLASEGLTQREIADAVGVSQATVSKHLSLLKLSDEAKQLVASGELSQEDAVIVAGLPDDLKEVALNGQGVGWAKRRADDRAKNEAALAELRRAAVPIFDELPGAPVTTRTALYWLTPEEIAAHDTAPCRAVYVRDSDGYFVELCTHPENHPRPEPKAGPVGKPATKEAAEALAKRDEVMKLRAELRETRERRHAWLAGLKGSEPGLATTAVGYLMATEELLIDVHRIADVLGDPDSEESALETVTRHASSATGAIRVLFLTVVLFLDSAVFEDQYGPEFEAAGSVRKAGLVYLRGLVALGYEPTAIERRFLGLSEPAAEPEPASVDIDPVIRVELKSKGKHHITCSECGLVGFNTKEDMAHERARVHAREHKNGTVAA